MVRGMTVYRPFCISYVRAQLISLGAPQLTTDPESHYPAPDSCPGGPEKMVNGNSKYCDAPPCGGGCKAAEMCNLNSTKCESCPPGKCCVTMSASAVVGRADLASRTSNLFPHFRPINQSNVRPRLTGAVVVYTKPCPRNYHCEQGARKHLSPIL